VVFNPSHGYTFESLVIKALEPPAASQHVSPETLITAELQDMAKTSKMTRKFKPKTQKREPCPVERGYWELYCERWDDQLKLECWAFLANYVGMGNAGWGIWCERDEHFERLRIYCWGCLVPHTYLLLYIGSQREDLNTGAVCYDADNAPIMDMG
jgi:hypothetical protein